MPLKNGEIMTKKHLKESEAANKIKGFIGRTNKRVKMKNTAKYLAAEAAEEQQEFDNLNEELR